MSERRWTPEQLAALGEQGPEFLVSAAAGSGKTAVLIERVRRAALGITTDTSGGERCDPARRVSLERMLVLTFTRAAAAELKARLRQALVAETTLPEGKRQVPLPVIREQLSALHRAQISTIHSFCGELVRRYGHTKGIAYQRLLAADEARLLRHELATAYLDGRLAGADDALQALAINWGGADGVGADDLSHVRFSKGLRETMLSLLDFQQSLPEPERWYRERCGWLPLDAECFDANHPLLARLGNELEEWRDWAIQQGEEIADELAAEHPGALYCGLVARRNQLLAQLSLGLGWEGLALFFGKALKEKQGDIKYKPTLLEAYRRDINKASPWYEQLPQRNDVVAKSLRGWQSLFSQPWEYVARRENATQVLVAELWQLARDFAGHYTAYKRQRGLADFNDMQLDALSILAAEGDGGELARDSDERILPSRVALELRQLFEHVLVDEHQDTNELQDAIIELVTRDLPPGGNAGRPRFVVGDLKQSIYTFRLAVPQLFAAARERLSQLDNDVGHVVKLQHNFRSQSRILDAINQVFEGLLTESLGGEDYSENRLLLPPVDAAQANADSSADYPLAELHIVVTDSAQAENDAVAAQDADTESASEGEYNRRELAYLRVAQVLQDMHQAGHPWRDMAILLRTSAGHVEPLLSVCAREGVPLYAPGRSGFYERPEISDALSLLHVVDNPLQDVPLAAVLSGPAVGLRAEEFLAVAQCRPEAIPSVVHVPLWDRLQAYIAAEGESELSGKLQRFLGLLNSWRDDACWLPVPELLWRIYADTGLFAAMAGLPGGKQRVANLYALHGLAREAADAEQRGVARFLKLLKLNRRAAGDLGEAPLLTEAQDVARVLTVHQAKGLEFPVVVVPDLDKRFNEQDLRGDVLWHRTAGIGGRFVDWHAPPPASESEPMALATLPERHDTLGRMLIGRAKHLDLLSEELRILYVAITRAKQRLVLVGAMDEATLGSLPAAHAGSRARSWFDWVAPQLYGQISQAQQTDGAYTATDDPWTVQLHQEVAKVGEAIGQSASRDAEPVSDGELTVVRRRLHLDYAYPGSQLLPVKIAVTTLAHRAPEPLDSDAAFTTAVENGAASARPLFMREEREVSAPTPAEIGTATHLLLEKLDFNVHREPAAIQVLIDELTEKDLIAADAAGHIDVDAIAQLVAELDAALDISCAELYPELPVALLARAQDDHLLEQLRNVIGDPPSPESLAKDDAVYIQGIIDLLVVAGNLATVVDYKTDRSVDADELKRRYKAQLEWYCRAVGSLLPGKTVHWAIYGLGGAGLVGPHEYQM